MTLKLPPPSDMIVPAEVVPFPQLIVAVKSLAGALTLASEKVATAAVKEIPGVALNVTALPVNAASTMVKVCAAELPTPGVEAVMEAFPSSARREAGTAAV